MKRRYEFKNNHGEWISAVKPNIGPGISERISEALRATGEGTDICHSIKGELRDALTSLLGVFSIFSHTHWAKYTGYYKNFGLLR